MDETIAFIVAGVTCARRALIELKVGNSVDPNDLIAGALACRVLAAQGGYPTLTDVVATQLCDLAKRVLSVPPASSASFIKQLDSLLEKLSLASQMRGA